MRVLRGARCGNSARRDLRGGHRATGVPTSIGRNEYAPITHQKSMARHCRGVCRVLYRRRLVHGPVSSDDAWHRGRMDRDTRVTCRWNSLVVCFPLWALKPPRIDASFDSCDFRLLCRTRHPIESVRPATRSLGSQGLSFACRPAAGGLPQQPRSLPYEPCAASNQALPSTSSSQLLRLSFRWEQLLVLIPPARWLDRHMGILQRDKDMVSIYMKSQNRKKPNTSWVATADKLSRSLRSVSPAPPCHHI